MRYPFHTVTTRRVRRGHRRGFNLLEMLVALAISSALLTSLMIALDASFKAYQATTEMASTHTVSRLAMNRMLMLIRSGQEFGPYPTDPLVSTVPSDNIQFRLPSGDVMTLRWIDSDPSYPEDNAIYVEIGADTYLLLEGVVAQYDGGGDQIMPFTLEYEIGRKLYRATIDLLIFPDDNQSTEIDDGAPDQLRLVASAMPRLIAYDR